MTDFTTQLKAMNACSEAIEWVNGRSLRKCWQVADRADWMLWLAAELDIDRKLLVLAACDCAETVLKHVPEDEDRPRKAIEVTRLWCDGRATIKQVRRAAAAASAANAASASASADAAAYAAWANADAAYTASASANAASASASAAANADAYASAAANADAYARTKAHKNMCRLVRKRIPIELIEQALENSNDS